MKNVSWHCQMSLGGQHCAYSRSSALVGHTCAWLYLASPVYGRGRACNISSTGKSNQLNLQTRAAAAAKSLQLCPTLYDPIDGSPPGHAIPGILQARTLERVAISFSNAGKWKVKNESEVAQSCPTLSDPMDCSLPGPSVHGIFQARGLEWGAIARHLLPAHPLHVDRATVQWFIRIISARITVIIFYLIPWLLDPPSQ